LRRPGRFDREVCLALPGVSDRSAILAVHTTNWPCPPSKGLLDALARATEGFAGADLAALCTGAVMESARRSLPNICDIVDSFPSPGVKQSGHQDAGPHTTTAVAVGQQQMDAHSFLEERLGTLRVLQRDWMSALLKAPPPCSQREGIANLAMDAVHPLPYHLAPAVLPVLGEVLGSVHASGAQLPPLLASAASMVSSSLGRSRLRDLEKYLLSVGLIETPVSVDPSATQIADPRVRENATTGKGGMSRKQQEGNFPPCRVLLCGEGELGQQYVAGVILGLSGSSAVTMIGLPQLLAAGQGSAVDGVAKLISGAQLSHSSPDPVVVFLPRLEAWAIEAVAGSTVPEGVAEETQRQSAEPTSLHKEAPYSPYTAGSPVPSPANRSFDGKPYSSFAGLQSPAGFQAASRVAPGVDETQAVSQPSETTYVSAAWTTLETCIAGMAKQHQVIVIGTCHRSRGELPGAIARFFSPFISRQHNVVSASLVDVHNSELLMRIASRAAAAAAVEVSSWICAVEQRLQREPKNDCPKVSREAGRSKARKATAPSAPQSSETSSAQGFDSVNEATLEWGQSLLTQVKSSLRILGQRLLNDKRVRLIGLPTASGRGGIPRKLQILFDGLPLKMNSMRSLARALAAGVITKHDDLLSILSYFDSRILQELGESRAGGLSNPEAQPNDKQATLAYSAFSALRDEIEEWVYSMTRKLKLDTPAAQTAVAAALTERHQVPDAAKSSLPVGRDERPAPIVVEPIDIQRHRIDISRDIHSTDNGQELERQPSTPETRRCKLDALKSWTIQLAQTLKVELVPIAGGDTKE